MRLKVWIFFVAIGFVLGFLLLKNPKPLSLESQFLLPEQEKSRLPKNQGPLILLSEYQDEKQTWNVEMNSASSSGHFIVGYLYSQSVPGVVDQPVYLCGYRGFASVSQALDRSPNCSREGDLLQKAPIGYISTVIRPGFLLLVRCRSKDGMYLSLQSSCRNPADQYQETLGAIRAYSTG